MPELPEVETLKRSLTPVIGRCFQQVEILSEHCLYHMTPEFFRERIRGRCIHRIDRRGKYLRIHLDDAAVMTVHLRMTGRLRLGAPEEAPDKHVHVKFWLDDGNLLWFQDTRKFGRLYLKDDPPGLALLGPEPMSDDFTPRTLELGMKNKKQPVKSWLLDQRRIAGLGNIYADESLFRAGVHPLRPVGLLTDGERQRLWTAIRQVLQEAIEACGTTFSDFQDSYGRPGNFGQTLDVYQRKHQPCRRCQAAVETCKVGGRTSHYCPNCQPLGGS